MNPILEAAREIMQWAQSEKIPACLIGGLAVQRWGQPRQTNNVDLALLVSLGQEEKVIEKLLSRYTPRRKDMLSYALKCRVVLIYASNGVPVDLGLGAFEYDRECLEHASGYEFEEGVELLTCSAEHLIIYKTVASREQDLADIRAVVERQFGRLDVTLIRKWLEVFSELKEDPDWARPFEEALRGAEQWRGGETHE